ncbi:MAG: DUF2752 domain-containing protein [Lachnospiraceae bacterium]|nr:DUF2752 domain-containing protein [Lachnospiraceae bacterium]
MKKAWNIFRDWFFYDGSEDHPGQKITEWSIEKTLTLVGYIALAIVLSGYAVLLLFFRDYMGEETCFMRIVFHLYCPVCGGSHAVLELLRLHPLQSLYWHPAVLPAILITVPFLGLNTLCILTKGKIPGMRYHDLYMVLVLAIMILNWIVKNVLLVTQGIEMLPY